MSRSEAIKVNGSFSNFFRHASKRQKEEVFIHVAKKANEDQRKLVEKVGKKKIR